MSEYWQQKLYYIQLALSTSEAVVGVGAEIKTLEQENMLGIMLGNMLDNMVMLGVRLGNIGNNKATAPN